MKKRMFKIGILAAMLSASSFLSAAQESRRESR